MGKTLQERLFSIEQNYSRNLQTMILIIGDGTEDAEMLKDAYQQRMNREKEITMKNYFKGEAIRIKESNVSSLIVDGSIYSPVMDYDVHDTLDTKYMSADAVTQLVPVSYLLAKNQHEN